MALARRNRNDQNIWPGFVDALATLLMVVIFLLMIFVISQLFLNDALVGRDRALDRLNNQISELANMLSLEQASNDELRSNLESVSEELRASLAKRENLEAQLASLRADRDTALAEVDEKSSQLGKVRAELEDAYKVVDASKEKIKTQLGKLAELQHQVEALEALKEELQSKLATVSEESKAKLAAADEEIMAARAEAALMNKQMKELKNQLAELNRLLDISEERDRKAKAQIKALGERLNMALASKVQELAKYRSEFFGRLRKILGGRKDIQIVGDRFVFQSEVLFASGSAELGTVGKAKLAQLAQTLNEISQNIPSEINWILQVEGHTDAVPIASSRFPSNWELSTARAISVVKYLRENGIPAKHLAATGYGEFQPLDPRNDEIAYRRNRRIELKLTQR
ncbi:peptidoglycan -binding protein [Aestuariispira ectoiniformans]|uniref:peptidoglycan -binding protein n=1 Tax=Aestuariispira ectoiniformans TaxID=2775080 RepID=UPI00223BFB76|nr:peptidoglycan -binding protein [Aestuariispira ectoiniformans]